MSTETEAGQECLVEEAAQWAEGIIIITEEAVAAALEVTLGINLHSLILTPRNPPSIIP